MINDFSKAMTNPERSCGAVVFTWKKGVPYYVIVQEMAGAYSFPKGHMEGQENEEETARREVFEETGTHPAFLAGFLQEDEYDLAEKPGVRKRVTYYLAELQDETPVPRPGEIRRIQLLPYEEALTCFEHENTRRILTAAHDFLISSGRGNP